MAADYINAGCLWNSGNFMFRASVFLEEYRKVDAPSVRAVTDAVVSAGRDLGFVTLEPIREGPLHRLCGDGEYAAGSRGPDHLRLVRRRFLLAVWELSEKDARGNAARGRAVFEDSRNCNVVTDGALGAMQRNAYVVHMTPVKHTI
jgi:mannose-1-phosphate guanylyltransferase / mannose-6-phosphate isomerase